MEIIKREQDGRIKYGYFDTSNDFILHREDGPAIIGAYGSQYWLQHDELHREDGPAVIGSNGGGTWYINNIEITNDVNQWLKDHNIDDWKRMTDEDKIALSFFMRSL